MIGGDNYCLSVETFVVANIFMGSVIIDNTAGMMSIEMIRGKAEVRNLRKDV